MPSRASSPTTAYWSNRSEAICPLPASMPRAMGRSNEAASLGRSAGARLMTTRFCGRWKPELTIARSTRCVLSLTAASGRPTSTVFGSPAGRDVDLDLDRQGVDAQEREGFELGEHSWLDWGTEEPPLLCQEVEGFARMDGAEQQFRN